MLLTKFASAVSELNLTEQNRHKNHNLHQQTE